MFNYHKVTKLQQMLKKISRLIFLRLFTANLETSYQRISSIETNATLPFGWRGLVHTLKAQFLLQVLLYFLFYI